LTAEYLSRPQNRFACSASDAALCLRGICWLTSTLSRQKDYRPLKRQLASANKIVCFTFGSDILLPV